MALTLANQVQLITKYSPDAFDEVYQKESMSSMLGMDKSLIRFSVDNARVVKIPKLSLGSLTNYRRNNVALGEVEGIQPHADASGNIIGQRGYGDAAASWTWETREMTQDRAARFTIELFDDEESGGEIVARTATEANRTKVIPEVDAYTFSKIAEEVKKYGLGNYVTGDISASAPLAAMNAAFKWLDDHEVPAENRIAFISTDYFNKLRSTPELYRRLDVEGAVDKKVSFKIVSYEGVPFVVVPPRRFCTGYQTNDVAGYSFTGKPINFICMDKGAAVQVIKYNKLKVLSGEMALAASNLDGFVVFVRVYYDCFIFDNKSLGIYVHVSGDAGVAPKNDFGMILNAEGIVTSILEAPAGQLTRVYLYTGANWASDSTGLDVGDAWTTDLTKFTGVAEGTAIVGAGPWHLVGVQNGLVIAIKTLTLSNGVYTLADEE